MQISAKELAFILKAEILGNPDAIVDKLSKIEEADSSSICFIANPKYEHYAEDSIASIIVVNSDFNCVNKHNTTFLKVENAYSSFIVLLEKFAAVQKEKVGIEEPNFVGEGTTLGENMYLGAFAYIGNNVKIGNGVKIYPNAYIGDNCVIADNVSIFPGVKIYDHCVVGEGTTIHAGTTIGSDGFGFAPQPDGTYKKVPQTGNVVIGKNVEIGSNNVIDRATMGSTVLKDGVKIDNLAQIAHNVVIGKNSVIASLTGISGSVKIGENVMIGGQVGMVGHITIANGVKVNAQSGITKSIEEEGLALSGTPAEPFRQHYKHQAYIRKIPELMKKIKELEKKLENI